MMNDLPKQWFTAGSNPLVWGSGGTYKAVPYEALPPLPARGDDDFAWLAAAPEVAGGISTRDDVDDDDVDPDEEEGSFAVRLKPLLAEANALGLVVPEAFVRFMSDPKLTARVPSCTACYLDLPDRLLPLPEGQPGRLDFIQRFWLENTLWYAMNNGRKLTPEERAYADAAKKVSLPNE